MLVESLIAFAWFLWVGQKVFFGKPIENESPGIRRGSEGDAVVCDLGCPAGMKWVLVGLIAATILVPLAGIPIVAKLVP